MKGRRVAVLTAGSFALAGLVIWFGSDPRPPGFAERQAMLQPTVPDPSRNVDKAVQEVSTPEPAPALEPRRDAAEPVRPSFDVVRVEPNGDAVVAGRSQAGSTVDLIANGNRHDRVVADTAGTFAMVPRPLPVGTNEVFLEALGSDGMRQRSREVVLVVVSADKKSPPLVALTSPEKATVILSGLDDLPNAPAAGAPAAAAGSGQPTCGSECGVPAATPREPEPRPKVRIVSVEAQDDGRLFVSGMAAAAATIQLYLNNTPIAPTEAAENGRLSFAINKGVRFGNYTVRLDDVEPGSGRVKSRAEVDFNVPAPAQPGKTVMSVLPPPRPRDIVPGDVASTATTLPRGDTSKLDSSRAKQDAFDQTDSGSATVPEIHTTVVIRGDNLWRISQRVYGDGFRYTMIFGANQPQIREPSRIYPGQIFVLPVTPPGTSPPP